MEKYSCDDPKLLESLCKSNSRQVFLNFIENLESFCDIQDTVIKKINGQLDKEAISITLANINEIRSDTVSKSIYDEHCTTDLDFIVTLTNSRGDQRVIKIPKLIRLPIYTKQGMQLGGQRLQMKPVSEHSKGFHLERVDDDKFEGGKLKGSYWPTRGKHLAIEPDKTGTYMKYVIKNKSNKCKISLAEALIALTGLPVEAIREITSDYAQGINSVILPAEDMKRTLKLNECREKLIRVMCGYKLPDELESIDYYYQRMVMNNKFYDMSEVTLKFMKQNMSFMSRCYGVSLARELRLANVTFPEGTVLDENNLSLIDESDIEELFVKYNDKEYRVLKRKLTGKFDESLLFNIANIIACDISGLKTYKYIDETPKVVTTIETLLNDYVYNALNKLKDEYTKCLLRGSIPVINGGRFSMKILHDFEEDFRLHRENFLCIIPLVCRNSISACSGEYQISGTSSEIKKQAREVTDSEFNLIDTRNAPESKKAGVNKFLASTTTVNKGGELCNYYCKVNDGIVDTKYFYKMSANDLYNYTVTNATWSSPEDIVTAVKCGHTVQVKARFIDYNCISPISAGSKWSQAGLYSRNNKARRLQMSANELNQFLPILGGKRCIAASGLLSTFDDYVIRCNDIVEKLCATNKRPFNKSYCEAGVKLDSIVYEGNLLIATFSSMSDSLTLPTVIKCDHLSTLEQLVWTYEPNLSLRTEPVWYNDEIVLKPYDLDTTPVKISEDSDLQFGAIPESYIRKQIEEKAVACSRDIIVGYGNWHGFEYEDGALIRQGLCEDLHFTHIVTHKVSVELESTKNYEIRTIKHSSNPKIDDRGWPKLDKHFDDGETLIEIEKVFKDSSGKSSKKSIPVKVGYAGYVHSVEEVIKKKTKGGNIITKKYLEVTLGHLALMEEGDKFAGHFGNKSVITRILPDYKMPHLADGTPIDLMFNPLGVPSRNNIGQTLETRLKGKKINLKGETLILSPYSNSNLVYEIESDNDKFGMVDVYDPDTLNKLPNKMEVGIQEIMKLDHSVEKKMSAINEGQTINSKTRQPSKGEYTPGAQSISELGTNGALGNNCPKFVRALFGVGSDDPEAHRKMCYEIMKTGKSNIYGESKNYDCLIAYFRAIGFNISGDSAKGLTNSIMTDEAIRKLGKRIPLTMDKETIISGHPSHYYKDKHDNNKIDRRGYTYIDCGNLAWVIPFVLNRHMCKLIPVTKTTGKPGYLSANDISSIMNRKIAVTIDQSMKGDKSVVLYNINDEFKSFNTKYMTGSLAFLYIFKSLTKKDIMNELESSVAFIEKRLKERGEETDLDMVAALQTYNGLLKSWKNMPELSDCITNKFLQIPLGFRPVSEKFESDSMNILTEKFIFYAKRMDLLKDLNTCSANDLLSIDKKTAESYDKLYKYLYRILTADSVEEFEKKPSVKTVLTLIKSKEVGIARSAIFKRRYRNSGRSVIVGDPRIGLEEIGIPIPMALEMWEPKVIYWLTQSNDPLVIKALFGGEKPEEFDANIFEYISNIVDLVKYKDIKGLSARTYLTIKESLTLYNTVIDIVRKGLRNEVCVADREPILHRQNIEGFVPVLVEGKAIRINTLICSPYNADFDGDQMAVHAPLNEEAKEEVLNNMLPRYLLKEDRCGDNNYPLKQDLILGYFVATRVEPKIEKDLTLKEYNDMETFVHDVDRRRTYLTETVKYNGEVLTKKGVRTLNVVTTAGRLYLAQNLPLHYGFDADNGNLKYDKVIYKYELNAIVESYSNELEATQVVVLNELKLLGFKLQDLDNVSISVDDYSSVREIPEVKKVLESKPDVSHLDFMDYCGLFSNKIVVIKEEYDVYTKECVKAIKEHIPDSNNLGKIFRCKCRGDFESFVESIVFGGYMKNLKEQFVPTPVQSSLLDGHTPYESFNAGHEVIRSQLSTTLGTADSGAATRHMTLLAEAGKVDIEDCGTGMHKHKLHRKITENCKKEMIDRVVGHYLNSGCEAYRYFGNKRLTAQDIEVIEEYSFDSIVLDTGEEFNIEYYLDNLSLRMYKNRVGYRLDDNGLPIPEETILTEADVEDYFNKGKREINVRLLYDCKCRTGICQKCFGLDINNKKAFPFIGKQVGIIASQTLGEGNAQSSMDLKNAKSDAGNNTDVVSFLHANIDLSRTVKPAIHSIYTHYKQKVVVRDVGDNTNYSVKVNKKEYIVRKERVIVGDKSKLDRGIKVIDGIPAMGYVNELLPLEESRDIIFKNYYMIFAENDNSLDTRHIELLVAVQSSTVFINNSDHPSIIEGNLYKKSYIDFLNTQGYNIRYTGKLASFTNCCLADGFLKGACSEDPMKAISRARCGSYTDPLTSNYSRMGSGLPLYDSGVFKKIKGYRWEMSEENEKEEKESGIEKIKSKEKRDDKPKYTNLFENIEQEESNSEEQLDMVSGLQINLSNLSLGSLNTSEDEEDELVEGITNEFS